MALCTTTSLDAALWPRGETGFQRTPRPPCLCDRRLPFPPYGKRIAKILSQPEQLKRYSGSSMNGDRGDVWIPTFQADA